MTNVHRTVSRSNEPWVRSAALFVGITVLSVVAFHVSSATTQQVPVTTRASVGAAGQQANGESTGPSLSADGRFVAFVGFATNLVVGDTNGLADVFVKDLLTGTISRASVSSTGAQGDGESVAPSISGDGRYVAFTSEATNLAPGDTNEDRDVFVHDLTTGATLRASEGSGGEQADAASYAPSISGDGRHVAFASHARNFAPGDANKASDVFVKDLETATLERISVGSSGEGANGASEGPSISVDGRYVAFATTASNLLPLSQAQDTNRVWDVYVRDRLAGTTVRASLSTGSVEGNGHSFAAAISVDGRYVAFSSEATTLVDGDTNQSSDVFMRDLQEGVTARVSVGPGGVQAVGHSSKPSISGDGRLVVFNSFAANLVGEDTNGVQDVFLHDRASGSTSRVSVGLWSQANGVSLWPAISRDGRFVAFPDGATDLVPGDTNNALDIFVRGPSL